MILLHNETFQADHRLPWAVCTKHTGRMWAVQARFVDEASAWEFGAKFHDARVYHGDECLGQRSGGPGRQCWDEPRPG